MSDQPQPPVERVYLLARRASTDQLMWMCLPVLQREGDLLHIGGPVASTPSSLAGTWHQVPMEQQLREAITTCSLAELLRDEIVVTRSVEDDVFLLCLDCHPIGHSDDDRLLVKHAFRYGHPGTTAA